MNNKILKSSDENINMIFFHVGFLGCCPIPQLFSACALAQEIYGPIYDTKRIKHFHHCDQSSMFLLFRHIQNEKASLFLFDWDEIHSILNINGMANLRKAVEDGWKSTGREASIHNAKLEVPVWFKKISASFRVLINWDPSSHKPQLQSWILIRNKRGKRNFH